MSMSKTKTLLFERDNILCSSLVQCPSTISVYFYTDFSKLDLYEKIESKIEEEILFGLAKC